MKIIANVNLEKTCQATDLPANIQYANELRHDLLRKNWQRLTKGQKVFSQTILNYIKDLFVISFMNISVISSTLATVDLKKGFHNKNDVLVALGKLKEALD